MDFTIFIGNNEAIFTFGLFTEADDTGHFRHDGMIFRTTRFK